MYQLFCDSNCELWHTEAKALGLRVIRMPYVLDGEEFYYDLGENTDFKHFYDRMRAGAVPTTSAINEQNYIDYFEAFVQTLRQEFGEDIKVDYQIVGPVIAAHCGPGTLGLIFYGNK